MIQQAYKLVSKSDLILRDQLAMDRTILANERTLLAYVRTALAFLVTGVGLIKFFQDLWLEILGGVSLFLSLTSIFFGIWRYRRYASIYKILRKELFN
ncbi:MAG: DUF202 domain-containing protein [candidate division KSB1 bacterium]|nr:DUF202 domain-containing protein [candidate division KSB1 bacterium]MDZ7377052.1 DUF202 domain-containing protein [candidate division KSB1 bacterium]MDZ7399353.1 DUF202 domain-containing protein [candidate division KSB1 bacterium]